MNPWRWVDSRVSSVRLAHVQDYFRRRGWTMSPALNPNFLRFERSEGVNGTEVFQVVPASEELDDFRQRVIELITTLSELEDCHPVAVLEDILGGGEEESRTTVSGARKGSGR
jgi:hypothetical protein